MLPSVVHTYSVLPTNASGKVDKKALSANLVDSDNEVSSDSDLSEFEAKVAAIWQEVLGVERVGRYDDFFLIGGQSLQSIQLATRLSSLMNETIPVSKVFDNPRLAELCQSLQSESKLELKDVHTEMAEDVAALSAELPSDINSCLSPKPSLVVLTGATGFVGAQLLNQLLQDPEISVICPVRADNSSHGMARVEAALLAQGLDIRA
ncbi:hypothetical protein CS022_08630 [Veronia nyctiphanis]|uniref:Carrier domain-containing protein n=1 Tax=Veronia nyctiphanis TaxID=1278244 RepID=A0A4Q0YWY6_9GAMM|nr:phosphopantetheine-binding protein [Veronia nyctiphanis]RXJ73561.1 hypothetical protein CS022_08630 [Veronia nyctiphanis]